MSRQHLAGNPSDLAWFKSSYSDGTEGDSCVEVALGWFKSSYSSSSEGDSCVEVATTPGIIHIRDSKQRIEVGPLLTFTPATWADFVPYAIGR
jgi:hypothetical protein